MNKVPLAVILEKRFLDGTPYSKYEDEAGSKLPICTDFDEDCPGFGSATRCWLYDPEKGRCPLIDKG